MNHLASLQSRGTGVTASGEKNVSTTACSQERGPTADPEAATVKLQCYKFIKDRPAISQVQTKEQLLHAASFANSLTRGSSNQQGATRLEEVLQLKEEEPFVFIDDSSLLISSQMRAKNSSDIGRHFFPHNKAGSYRPVHPIDPDDSPKPESDNEGQPKFKAVSSNTSPNRSPPHFLLDSLADESYAGSIELFQEKNRSSKGKGIDTIIDTI